MKAKKLTSILFIFVFFLSGNLSVQAAVVAVDSVGLTVRDMEQSIQFYEKVLGFKKVRERKKKVEAYKNYEGFSNDEVRVVRMKLGKESIRLIQFLNAPGREAPPMESNDLWFQHIAIIVSDMEKAYEHLKASHVESISPFPLTLPPWNPKAGGIKAFYFKDPDGHPLEILQFPPDKGNPKWHKRSKRLFLGIDHTAIAISSTEKSLSFYQDILGLKIAGQSLNFGPEQDFLNGIRGSKVQITGLHANGGPGIEFLEYLKPGPGKPYPADARPNDLIHWETTMVVKRLKDVFEKLPAAGLTQIPVFSHKKKPRSLRVHDPDGHVLILIEK